MSDIVKTFMLVFVFNLVIGIMITAGGYTQFEDTALDYAIDESGDMTNKLDENFFEESQNDDLLTDSEYGNAYSFGKVIYDLLINGINPIPKMQSGNNIEMILAILIFLFRGWLYVLLIIQIYRLFKNRG